MKIAIRFPILNYGNSSLIMEANNARRREERNDAMGQPPAEDFVGDQLGTDLDLRDRAGSAELPGESG